MAQKDSSLSDELVNIAKKKLNETPETKAKALDSLKGKINSNKGL